MTDTTLLKKLAEARRDDAKATAELKKLQEQDGFKRWKLIQSTARRTVEDLTSQVREFYVNIFRNDGKEALPAQTKIQQSEVVGYDLNQALEWAKQNMPDALLVMLDQAVFEAHAQAVRGTEKALPFVTFSKVEKVTIASDLSSYLEPEPVQEPEVEIPF